MDLRVGYKIEDREAFARQGIEVESLPLPQAGPKCVWLRVAGPAYRTGLNPDFFSGAAKTFSQKICVEPDCKRLSFTAFPSIDPTPPQHLPPAACKPYRGTRK